MPPDRMEPLCILASGGLVCALIWTALDRSGRTP